jgi:hypothetical protein
MQTTLLPVLQPVRIANRFSRIRFEFDSSQRSKSSPDRFDKIGASSGTLAERTPQNLPRFLLHGTSMHRRAHLELSLGRLFQISDGNACHAINDITAIINCKRDLIPNREHLRRA